MDEGFGKEIGRKYTKGNQFRAFETAKTVLKRLFKKLFRICSTRKEACKLVTRTCTIQLVLLCLISHKNGGQIPKIIFVCVNGYELDVRRREMYPTSFSLFILQIPMNFPFSSSKLNRQIISLKNHQKRIEDPYY